jgi:outer membrane receptor protein involved in Fe transport
MNHKLFFLTVLLFTSHQLIAQHTISGKVEDTEKKEMPFVNVMLLQPKDSSLIKGTVTEDTGKYEITDVANGSYLLSISFMGFKRTMIPIEVLKTTDFGITTLEEQSEALDAVTITAQHQLIQRKIDRLVFNVENSSSTADGDAFEVLKVTPGIRVQNEKISMIGKSTMAVMIDDKLIKLSGEELSNFLRSIASEDIKSIEVITAPPAKYEASGNSGLINIQLKKAKRNAWNALVRAGYWQRTHPNGNGGANFNYNKNKFSIASSVFYRDGLYIQEQDDYAYFPDGLWYTASPFKANIRGTNARVDLNYQLTDKWTIGAQYLFNQTEYSVTDNPYTPVFDYSTNQITRSLQSQGTMDLNPTINALNFNSAIRLDTNGRKLTFNADYFTYKNLDAKTYTGVSTIQTPYSEQYFAGNNTNKQDVTNISGTIDLLLPTKWANLNVGGKATQSISQNDISLFNSGLVDNPITDFSITKNDFEYIENIQAIYISGSKTLGKKWETKLGLRMEATQTTASSTNLNSVEKNNYAKLFPTFYLAYAPNENSTLVWSYNKRITRPQFFDLNPNVYFVNPFQTIEGNPFLQPAFADNFEMGYTHKNLSSKVYFSNENDLFAQVPLPNSTTNAIRFTNENYINTIRYGLSESHTFNTLKWWTSNNSVDINYSISEFTLPTAQDKQEGFNSTISTNNNFVLNKARTISFNLNYWYSFPGINGVFDNEAISSLSASLQFLFLNKNLRVTLRGSDIFRTEVESISTTVNNVYQEARYYYDSQSFFISVSYKFGNKDIWAKRHQTGNQEERNRTGN